MEATKENLCNTDGRMAIRKLHSLREDIARRIQTSSGKTRKLFQEGLEYADDLINSLERMENFLESKIAEGKGKEVLNFSKDVDAIMFGVDYCFLMYSHCLDLGEWLNRAGIDREKYFGEAV